MMAQASSAESYTVISAGAAVEQPVYNQRSNVGVSGTGAVGWQISKHRAYEIRMSTAFFGAPGLFISPGGCLPALQCPRSSEPSDVRTLTVGGNVIFSTDDAQHESLFTDIGAGARFINEDPGLGTEVRPYAEIGAGITIPFANVSLVLEARGQFAPSSGGLSRFIAPITLGIRF